MEVSQHQQMEPRGQNENQKANYTEVGSDESKSQQGIQNESETGNTNPDDQDDEISGDLAGNASGNEDTE